MMKRSRSGRGFYFGDNFGAARRLYSHGRPTGGDDIKFVQRDLMVQRGIRPPCDGFDFASRYALRRLWRAPDFATFLDTLRRRPAHIMLDDGMPEHKRGDDAREEDDIRRRHFDYRHAQTKLQNALR